MQLQLLSFLFKTVKTNKNKKIDLESQVRLMKMELNHQESKQPQDQDEIKEIKNLLNETIVKVACFKLSNMDFSSFNFLKAKKDTSKNFKVVNVFRDSPEFKQIRKDKEDSKRFMEFKGPVMSHLDFKDALNQEYDNTEISTSVPRFQNKEIINLLKFQYDFDKVGFFDGNKMTSGAQQILFQLYDLYNIRGLLNQNTKEAKDILEEFVSFLTIAIHSTSAFRHLASENNFGIIQADKSHMKKASSLLKEFIRRDSTNFHGLKAINFERYPSELAKPTPEATIASVLLFRDILENSNHNSSKVHGKFSLKNVVKALKIGDGYKKGDENKKESDYQKRRNNRNAIFNQLSRVFLRNTVHSRTNL